VADGVGDEVVQAVQQFGRPAQQRQVVTGCVDRDRYPRRLETVRDLVKHCIERQFRKRVLGLGALGDADEDGAAARRLAFEQADVLAEIRVVAEAVGEFARDQRYGAERAAELVRSGGCQRAQRRHPRFPFQRCLRRDQRLIAAAALSRYQPRVAAEKRSRQRDSDRNADPVDIGQYDRRPAPRQRQRPMPQYQNDDRRHAQQQRRASCRQQRRGDGDWHDK
jgi:hypothetical protein